ncbi:MAG: outer membrane beta-barrel protein [Nitrosomonas sp.]|nr:outer membrane beta-barrel protein [Nitrosomonas sp.]
MYSIELNEVSLINCITWYNMTSESKREHRILPSAWYGINQYLLYDISNQAFGAGLRFEWFHDQNGTRVMGDGNDEDFIGVTAGLN